MSQGSVGGKRRKGVKSSRMDRAGWACVQNAGRFGLSCHPLFCYFYLGEQIKVKNIAYQRVNYG
jgi:hypothetical protein